MDLVETMDIVNVWMVYLEKTVQVNLQVVWTFFPTLVLGFIKMIFVTYLFQKDSSFSV